MPPVSVAYALALSGLAKSRASTGDQLSGSNHRLSAFVFFEREVDTRGSQRLQGGLESFAFDGRLDVAELTLRELQKPPVWTARVLEDAPADDPEEVRLALGQPSPHHVAGFVEAHAPAEKAGQAEHETPVHSKF